MLARYISFSLILICISKFQASAQSTVPDFGVFTAEEIAMKQCEFDKSADAVVLFDKASASYNDEYNLVTERRIRIKILKEGGVSRGDIHIPYYADEDFEFLYEIEAVVMNKNAQGGQTIDKLQNKSIYKKKLNKYYSEMSFALPNVHVGSIIEYKYRSHMKHFGGLREWVFQSEIPVALSSYNLTIIPNAEFAYTVYKSKFMIADVKPNKSNGSILFEMKNIPGLKEEAFMRARRDYIQRVSFQFSGYNRVEGIGYATTTSTTQKYNTTWKELAQDLATDKSFGALVTKNLPGSEVAKTIADSEPTAYKKMQKIFDYVRSNLSWNHIYSKFADDGLKSVWEKKTGASGEINLVLVNFLKSADLEAYPMLACERDYGHVDSTYPFMNQFNTTVACVFVDGKQYILDATDHYTPAFLTPFILLNTTGFIVDKRKFGLVRIIEPSKKNLNIVNLFGTIDASGQVRMKSSVKNFDYARIEKKRKYLEDKSSYQKDFFEPYTSLQVDSFEVVGIENDSLPITHNIETRFALNRTGDYYLANYNLFSGLNKNPFINDFRFSDIDFGTNYLYLVNGTFEIPDNMIPETLPKNLRLTTSDKTIGLIRQVTQNGRSIQIGIKIDITKTEFSADAYPEIQAFYKQMLETLNEPIVLKPKS